MQKMSNGDDVDGAGPISRVPVRTIACDFGPIFGLQHTAIAQGGIFFFPLSHPHHLTSINTWPPLN